MKQFTVYDASGKVVRFGTCLPETFEAQAHPGETVVEGIPEQQPSQVVTNYTYDRMLQYPAVGSQLDALYKLVLALREQGIEIPAETAAWLDEITRVKESNPKGGA